MPCISESRSTTIRTASYCDRLYEHDKDNFSLFVLVIYPLNCVLSSVITERQIFNIAILSCYFSLPASEKIFHETKYLHICTNLIVTRSIIFHVLPGMFAVSSWSLYRGIDI